MGSKDPQAQGQQPSEAKGERSPSPYVPGWLRPRARPVRASEHYDMRPRNRNFRREAVPFGEGIMYKHLNGTNVSPTVYVGV